MPETNGPKFADVMSLLVAATLLESVREPMQVLSKLKCGCPEPDCNGSRIFAAAEVFCATMRDVARRPAPVERVSLDTAMSEVREAPAPVTPPAPPPAPAEGSSDGNA